MPSTYSSTKIRYPVNTCFPTSGFPPTARSAQIPDVQQAYHAQINVQFAFSKQAEVLSDRDFSYLDSDLELQSTSSRNSADSELAPQSQIPASRFDCVDIYVLDNGSRPHSFNHPSVPTEVTSEHQQERNLVRNLAPGEGLRLGYGPMTGPHFVRIPHPSARDRIGRACDKCRSRKTKCTGEKPSCQRCIDRRLDCVYSEARVRAPSKYQQFLRQQTELQAEAQAALQAPAIPVVLASQLPPHSLAFDDQLRIPQKQQHLRVTTQHPELLCASPSAQTSQQGENQPRHTRFALPGNPVYVNPPSSIPAFIPKEQQLQHDTQEPYQPFALPGNLSHSLPKPVPEAISYLARAGGEQQNLPTQLLPVDTSMFVLQPTTLPGSVLNENHDVVMSFAPMDDLNTEFPWFPVLDSLDAGTDSSIETYNLDLYPTIDLLPLQDNVEEYNWLLAAFRAPCETSCSPTGFFSPHTSSSSGVEVYMDSLANASAAYQSSSPSSASSGSLPTTPSPQIPNLPVIDFNSQTKSQILEDASNPGRPAMSDEEVISLLTSVFGDQVDPVEQTVSPPIMFNFDFDAGEPVSLQPSKSKIMSLFHPVDLNYIEENFWESACDTDPASF